MNDPRSERLAAYLDGELDESAAAELRRELAADPTFARQAAQTATVDRLMRLHLSGATGEEFAREAALRAGKASPSGPFVKQVMHSVRAEEFAPHAALPQGSRWRGKRWWMWVGASTLAAGILLTVSWAVVAHWQQERTLAVVERVSGTVTIQRGSHALPALKGTPVLNGDTLAVSTPGYLVVRYADDKGQPAPSPPPSEPATQTTTTLSGASGSRFKLFTEQDAPRVELLWGDLVADVAPRPPASALKFSSRFATAAVVGTKLKLRVDDWRTRLEVTEGKVSFQDKEGGTPQLVGAGQRASATSKQLLPELACHLKFDGDAKDSSTAQVPMAWVGEPKYAAGRLGQAAVFNGLNGRANGNRVVAKPHPALYGMRQMTVALWVKRNNPAASSYLLWNHIRYGLIVWRDTVQYSLFLGKGEYGQDVGTYRRNAKLEALNNSDWHHLAMSYDGSSLRGYVDGHELFSQKVNAGEIAEYTEYILTVGGTPWDEGLDGLLDDLRIYRRALNTAEIARLSQGREP